MRRLPPPKKADHKTGLRTLNGEALDVRHAATLLFGEGAQKNLRRLVDRRLVPYRRLNGRIVFLRSELLTYLNNLPGCTAEQAMANTEARQGDVQHRH